MDSTGRIGRQGWATLVVTAVILLAACGGEPDDQPRGVADPAADTATRTTTSSPPARDADDAPAAAYAAWLNALARQDAGAACALQAPEFTIELRFRAILADRAELGDPCPGFEAILWEDPGFRSELVDVSVTQVTEEDALLEVALGPGTETFQTVRMVYHRARWRVFSTADRTEAGTETGPARWVAAWCQLTPDQTRDEIVALMGAPSGEYTVADGGEPQLWWAKDQYDFRVYLDPTDPDDPVLELVGDYDALGADDRAQLPCPELRR